MSAQDPLGRGGQHHFIVVKLLRWLVHRGENDEVAARSIRATETLANEVELLKQEVERHSDPFEEFFSGLHGGGK